MFILNMDSFLVKENHQSGWWFQKALAMPSLAAAESLPCVRGGAQCAHWAEGLFS